MINQMLQIMMMTMLSAMYRGMTSGFMLQSGRTRTMFPDTAEAAKKSIDDSGIREELRRALGGI